MHYASLATSITASNSAQFPKVNNLFLKILRIFNKNTPPTLLAQNES